MNIGKKILSALVELPREEEQQPSALNTNVNAHTKNTDVQGVDKFRRHFAVLLEEANGPGPDYFEFSKMTGAMRVISDEGARYAAAFAGLQAQGLQKAVLLESAHRYLAVLAEDARRFTSSLDGAVQEQVQARHQELETNKRRIEELSLEIKRLQERNTLLETEIRTQNEKLESNEAAYRNVLREEEQKIRTDIALIEKHIH